MRGVGIFVVGFGVLGVLAGCKPTWFEAREPWRAEAEQQCLKSGVVKESPAVALLRPISGPGVCGADFPLKVAALGESAVLGFADELRPPGLVPQSAPVYPRAVPAPSAYPPSRAPTYSDAPITISPPSARTPAIDRGGYTMPDTMMNDSGAQIYSRPGVQPRPMPEPVYQAEPDEYEPEPDPPHHDPRARQQERWREQPRTVAPVPPPRAAPVPLGRARIPINATAAVQPAATLACPIVSALDRWIVDAVQPAALRWFSQPVTEIRQISAYSCRGMNGQVGARISEHAFGNALDIASFTLADGRRISVKDGWRGAPEEQGFLRDVQSAACEHFTTVLAPGSNRFHYDHIHVDLMRRNSGTRICNPEAVSGAEVAARAARQGRGLVQRNDDGDRRNDPFAWRGGARGRDVGPTGSTRAQAQHRSPNSRLEYTDDEEALVD
jgi:hypothetical protein